MRVEELKFTDYYQKYLIIEADNLTDYLKESIDVKEEDCFALCSCYCAKDGLLEFNVLAIGPSWKDCKKGLRKNHMLGVFTIDQVFDLEAKIVEPTYSMMKKNAPWIEKMDEDWDEDILKTRKDPRLDHLRDIFYPDLVFAGIIINRTIMEYGMRITGVKGPFLVGVLEEEPTSDIGLHFGDSIWALPYAYDESPRLFALFAGDDLSQDEIEIRDRIVQEMSKMGISFTGLDLKS